MTYTQRDMEWEGGGRNETWFVCLTPNLVIDTSINISISSINMAMRTVWRVSPHIILLSISIWRCEGYNLMMETIHWSIFHKINESCKFLLFQFAFSLTICLFLALSPIFNPHAQDPYIAPSSWKRGGNWNPILRLPLHPALLRFGKFIILSFQRKSRKQCAKWRKHSQTSHNW